MRTTTLAATSAALLLVLGATACFRDEPVAPLQPGATAPLLSLTSALSVRLVGTEIQVTASPAAETNPTLGSDASSSVVAFTKRDGGGPGQVYYQRLNPSVLIGFPVLVSEGGTHDQVNDMQGDYIIYTSYLETSSSIGEVKLYEISSGMTTVLSQLTDIFEARVHGRMVAWVESAAGFRRVMLYNLDGLARGGRAIQIAGPSPDAFDVEIGDRLVVWTERVGTQLDVAAYEMTTGQRLSIAADPATDEQQPSTSGDWVTWQSGNAPARIEAYNVGTGERRTIVRNGAINRSPTIDGDLIAYESNISGNFDMYVHRLAAGQTFQVTSHPADQRQSHVFGGELFGNPQVAYVDARDGNDDVFVTTLAFVPVEATTLVTFAFSGTIAEVLAIPPAPFEGVSPGDLWTLTYTFDATISDVDGRATAGQYRNPVTVMTLAIGAASVTGAPGVARPDGLASAIFVNLNPGFADYSGSAGLPDASAWAQVALFDDAGTPFIDDVSPVDLPTPLADAFPTARRFFLRRPGSTQVLLLGTVGTFRVEPRPDDAPPQLALPEDMTVPATGSDGAAVSYTVSATDDVDPGPDVACTPPSGSVFPIGSTQVECTATDAAGNAATGRFMVTVEAPNTMPGSDVTVEPVDPTTGTSPVTLTFDEVLSGGETSVVTSGTGPPPPQGFKLGSPPVYYEIETRAGFTPPITVCINYTGVSFGNESRLKLMHNDGSGWVDVTLPGYPDTENDVICGEVSSLSPFIVAEENVAPVVGSIALPGDPMALGTPISISASFTDANPTDIHVGTIDWGDGTAPSAATISELPGAGTASGSHTYAAAGVYTVTVAVSDQHLQGIRTSALDVPAYVVVYDPDGGFVTGGGWIHSEPGWCQLNAVCPGAAGKASFGFVSKYQRGATVPSGNTEFEFRAGGLRFTSSVYQWLVIAGPKAQYKGSGTINGGGDYGFLLTANDGQVNGGGGVDRFRIKIWENATGVVVYDNQPGNGDGAPATTALGGGSIVIHAN